jgi:hypothetical protein
MGSANKRVNNEALWRQRIKDQAASAQSVAGYCRDNGLVVATFHWWKARLRKSASALVVRKAPTEVPFIDLGSVNLNLPRFDGLFCRAIATRQLE